MFSIVLSTDSARNYATLCWMIPLLRSGNIRCSSMSNEEFILQLTLGILPDKKITFELPKEDLSD